MKSPTLLDMVVIAVAGKLEQVRRQANQHDAGSAQVVQCGASSARCGFSPLRFSTIHSIAVRRSRERNATARRYDRSKRRVRFATAPTFYVSRAIRCTGSEVQRGNAARGQ